MTRKILLAAFALAALASPVLASKFDIKAQLSKADFDVVKTRLIAQMDSDQYTEITTKDKATVVAALDRIDERLAKPELGDQDRVDIFNDQELINQITSHAAAESRLYCEREEPTGSHVIHVTCMTIAKWMEREHAGQTAMQEIDANHRIQCPACPP
jgi:hypothetical protein